MEMQVTRAGSVKAIWHGVDDRLVGRRVGADLRIPARCGNGVASSPRGCQVPGGFLVTVDRVAVVEQIDLVQEGEFHHVAQDGPQCRAGERPLDLVDVERARLLVILVETPQLRQAVGNVVLWRQRLGALLVGQHHGAGEDPAV